MLNTIYLHVGDIYLYVFLHQLILLNSRSIRSILCMIFLNNRESGIFQKATLTAVGCIGDSCCT